MPSEMDEIRELLRRTVEEGDDTPSSIGLGGMLSEAIEGPIRPEHQHLVAERHAIIAIMYTQAREPETWARHIAGNRRAGHFSRGIHLKLEPEKGQWGFETRAGGLTVTLASGETDIRRYPQLWYEGAAEAAHIEEFKKVLEEQGFFELILLCKDKCYQLTFDGAGELLAAQEGAPVQVHTMDGEYGGEAHG